MKNIYMNAPQRREILSMTIGFFMASVMVLLAPMSGKAAYYSSFTTGNWNTPGTWRLQNGSIPAAAPGINDTVNISLGTTVFLSQVQSARMIYVGYTGNGGPAVLELQSSARSYSLTVGMSVFIAPNCTLQYQSTATGRPTVNVGKDIINSGHIDLYANASNFAELVFNSAQNSIVSNGTWDLGTVTVNKSSRAGTLTTNTNAFELATRTLNINIGTFNHNNTGIYSINSGVNYTLGPNAILKVPMGRVQIASAADSLLLQGEVYISGSGNLTVGSGAARGGIFYDQNGTITPRLDISGASSALVVNGGITYTTQPASFAGSEPFIFNRSGGSITLNNSPSLYYRPLLWITDVAGSAFMNNGSITFVRPNAGPITVTDISLCISNGTVGGTNSSFVFGTGTSIAKSFTFNPIYNPSSCNAYPNMQIMDGAKLAPAANSSSGCNINSITINPNGVFDVRSANGSATGDSRIINLQGINANGNALENYGNFVARTGTVRFSSCTIINQYIGGSISTPFYRMEIANTGGVTLRLNTSVTNFLQLTNGTLNTGLPNNHKVNVLTLTSTANNSAGTSSSYVNGPMIHTIASTNSTNKVFPIGAGQFFRPVELRNIFHSTNGQVSYLAVVKNQSAYTLPPTLPANLSGVSLTRYVTMERTGPANFTAGSIKMTYGPDDGVVDPNSLVIAQDRTPTVTTWINLGSLGASGTTNGSISATIPRNNFNPAIGGINYMQTNFTLGNPPGGGNPLPINLLAFDAFPLNNQVELRWSTATEINNDHFTVERSKDMITYETVGQRAGAGTVSQTHTYSLMDEHPLRGISYYRLRQVDFDGQETVYGPAVVEFTPRKFSIYPNPCINQTVHIDLEGDQLQPDLIRVNDIMGRNIPFTMSTGTYGDIELRFDSQYLQAGRIYFITLNEGYENQQQKLLVQ